MKRISLNNNVRRIGNEAQHSSLSIIYYPLSILIILSLFFSCTDMVPTKEVRLIDSLNGTAYAYRYRNLDSSYKYAEQAYSKVNFYKSGKAEALNNLGFWAFMNMDFDRAEASHKEVYKLTKNELELLIADIGLMKICQRTAMNKEFYDYRNSALRRMKRIREESDLLPTGTKSFGWTMLLRSSLLFPPFITITFSNDRKRLRRSVIFRKRKHWRILINCFTIIILRGPLLWLKQRHRRRENYVSLIICIILGGRLFRAIILISKEMVCKVLPT